jgi:hypothetical protein
MNYFIFYNTFWLIKSVKISYNDNNINGKLFWIWWLYFTVTYLFYIYLSPSNSDRDISTSSSSSIYFIVILKFKSWNLRLKIVEKYETMFWFKVFSLFWLQKQMWRTEWFWALVLYWEELANIRELKLFSWTLWIGITSSYSCDQITC